MIKRKPGTGSQKHVDRRTMTQQLLQMSVVCILVTLFCSMHVFAAEKWRGVDEAVVEKIAKEHGREAHEPLINADQGDLLLFVFLIAGAIGGFAAGYYWRMLMVERAPKAAKKT
jgi:ABC-type cobalt transport system substrate-binding protein